LRCDELKPQAGHWMQTRKTVHDGYQIIKY
jgi:hypothetical protein